MNLQHVNVKIFVDGVLAVDPRRFIEVFHRWVAEQSMDELLIDVADYRHVPAGPGIMLVGHEADYSLDNTANRWGLRYNYKATREGSNADRLSHSLQSAAKACSLLETEFSNLKFAKDHFELSINDRSLAPNTDETFAACKAELMTFLQSELGENNADFAHDIDPRKLFSMVVKLSKPLELASLSSS